MLTTVAPRVKLEPDTTPEQQSCTQDIDRALTLFWNLVERVQDAAEAARPDPPGRGDHRSYAVDAILYRGCER